VASFDNVILLTTYRISLKEKITTRPKNDYLSEIYLSPDQKDMFEDFGPDLCRQWGTLLGEAASGRSSAEDLVTAAILNDLRAPSAGGYQNPREPTQEIDSNDHGNVGIDNEENAWFSAQLMNAPDWHEPGAMGNWLFTSQFQNNTLQNW
jgi:hypothetical protein